MLYCYFFLSLFFSTRYLRGPWADLREILPHVRKRVRFINAGPEIRGSAPQKNWGAKNTLNLARFRASFQFEREYLRNGWRYPKSEKWCTFPSHVQRIKVGELWSTNHRDLEVQLYRENRIFRNTIFWPLGCDAPEILYAL